MRRCVLGPPVLRVEPTSAQGCRGVWGGVMESALRQAIVDDPGAVEPWLVYVDWLESRGHPRAAFARRTLTEDLLPCTVAAPAVPKALHGPLRDFEHCAEASWRAGFMHTLRLSSGRADMPDCLPPSFVDQILAHESAGFVERIELPYAARAHWQADLDALVRQGPFPMLRELQIGPDSHGQMLWHSVIGDCTRLWEHFPRLTQLTVRGHDATLGELRMPQLRELTLVGYPEGLDLTGIRADHCPALDTITIDSWHWQEPGEAQWAMEQCFAGLRPRSLTIRGVERTEALLWSIAQSPWSTHLEVLDLSGGTLTVIQLMAALAGYPDRLPALHRIVLNDDAVFDALQVARRLGRPQLSIEVSTT